MSKKSNAGKFALAAGIGAALGAIGGVLFAPKSGKETREDVSKKAKQAKKYATEKCEKVKGKAKDLKNKLSADEEDTKE